MAKNQPIVLFLCFESTSAEEIQLTSDYWRGSEVSGRWVWDVSVEHVAEEHGIPKKDILALVKSAGTAVNLARRCTHCAFTEQFSSRTAISYSGYGEYICPACLTLRMQTRQRQKDEDQIQKQKEMTRWLDSKRAKLAEISKLNEVYDYDNIGYTDAVIAYGIMLASDDACERGEFQGQDIIQLCAGSSLSSSLLGRLHNAGILCITDATPLEAIEISESGECSYFPFQVLWKFAPDAAGRSFPELMRLLSEIIDEREVDPNYGSSAAELWRMLAYDDAVQHLHREVDTYRLPAVRPGPKTDEAIWHALEHLSIPQVRREITNVVKNAAALAQRRDFQGRHALNTIPGNLIKYVDRALSEGWQVTPLLRDWQNDEPILLTLLFDRVLAIGLTGFKTASNSVMKGIDQEAEQFS